MEYVYNTEFTCARRIKVEINGDVVTNVEFWDGGCNGNLKAVPRLVDGMTVEQIEKKLGGITCGRKPTSCADQLTKAVRAAFEEEQRRRHNN
ncbi:MAG: TIGR03905 family TSCPD domain-containing protein [Lachnospiraceae bacterium]|nr:TIGR03905 family TSCPD domain-containing protein [Lachnospiraceae bacterium]